MRTHEHDPDLDGKHEPHHPAGVTPHGPASSNPARELAGALNGRLDRDRGSRDRALRALERRGTDPEWRDHRDDDSVEPDDLEAAVATMAAERRAGEPDDSPARQLDAGASDTDDRPPPPTAPPLCPPGDIDLRWLRPPDDLLLRRWPRGTEGGEEGADANDLDARLRRRPGPPDPDAAATLDRDLHAQSGARPQLDQNQKRPTDLRAPRTGRLLPAVAFRGDPKRRPLAGLTTSDAAKRAADIQKTAKDLDAGPQIDKTRKETKPAKAPAPPTTVGPAPPKEPEKKEPDKKKERPVIQGDPGDGAVGAWQQRQVEKVGVMKVEPVPDAERYVVTYRAATTAAAQMTPLKKLELLEQAEQKAKPVDTPEDVPKLANPSEFVQAETAVREKMNLKLPEQTMPDLEPTPLGNQPEVGMRIKMKDDGKAHIVKETTGPDGKVTSVEFKVVPEDAKPGTDDKAIQVKTPKPSKNLADSVTKLREVGAKKKVEVKQKGGGKGQKISDDRRLGAPPVPPFAAVDVGSVIAKLLANTPKYTARVVDQARDAFAGTEMYESETSEFLAGERPVITDELHKIARAANVTDKELEKKRLDEEAKLKQEVEKQHDKKEDAAGKTGGAIQTKGSELEAHIGGVAAGINAHLQEQKVIAEGGSEPAEIKREAKSAKNHIGKLVSKWRGEYKRMGTQRTSNLEAARQKQSDAYSAAAEIDYRQIDLQLGVKSARDRKDDAPEYKPTKDWLKATVKELYQDVDTLVTKAGSFAEAYVTGVSEGGDQAFTLIEAWEKDLLGKEKSWWDKLVDWIKSWFGTAKQEVRQWETDSTEDNNVNISKDMIWLERARILQYQDLSEDTIKKSGSFNEEQIAMLLELKAGGDSATALAAGLMARISQQRRDGLKAKFERKVMASTNAAAVERISIGNAKTQAPGFARSIAIQIHNMGVGRSGTDEQGIFDALGKLTKMQARAVELAYAIEYPGRDMRADLKGELYDWTQQITGSTGDWDRAEAALEGNSARVTAIQLYQAMHETFLGTGWGTDSDEIFKLLKGKSPAEIAAIKREYRAYYGEDLLLDASKELDDGFSTRHDSDRFVAIMNNRPDVARVIEADSKMRGSIFGRTDRAGVEQVYKDVAAEVEKEADEKGWSPDRIKREIVERYAALDDMYEGIYGGDFDPSERATGAGGKKESALRTAMRESFTWGTGKAAWNFTTSTGDMDLLLSYHDLGLAKDAPDINVAWRKHLAESNAARIQIEHRSLFNASDKEIDKALAEQYESAYRDRLREAKLSVQAEKEKDFDGVAKMRSEAEKLKGDAKTAKLAEAQKLETDLKHKWAPEGQTYLARMRRAKQEARTAAQDDAKVNMAALSSTYEAKYKAWNKQYNFGEDKDFKQVVRGDTGWGNWLNAMQPGMGPLVESVRTKDNDKTIALLEGSGYLSPEDKLYFAVLPYGSTDEDTAKEVFGDTDSVEAKEILTRLGIRLQGRDPNRIGPPTPEDQIADAKAYDLAKDWVLDDFSGREYQDQSIAMMGVPHTPHEHLAIAEKKLEFEKNSGPGAFADSLPYLAPFGSVLLLTPFTAPFGGALLAGSQLGETFKGLDAESLGLLQMEVDALRRAKAEADRQAALGFQPGDEDYDKAMRQVSLLSDRVNNAMLLHRSEVDAMTDIVTTVVTVIVTVVVMAVSFVLSPFTGGASAAAGAALTSLMWTALIGSVAATLANIAVKMAMKGDAYGWEEIGYDAAIGLVEAVASALTAGMGDKFLKAGFLMKMGQAGVLQRIAAHGLANAAEGLIQSLPGALAGNILNDNLMRLDDPFSAILLGTVTQMGMAGAMSGGIGGLVGGVRKPTHFIRPGTDAYNELWHQYKIKNPSATPDSFRLELHQKILAGNHPSLGRKQLEEVAREQIVAGLDGEAAKAFKKLKVEVVPADEFTRITRSQELGEAVVMLRRGEPTVVVKAGADFQNLHREAPHLMQTLRADTARLMRKLDESVLAHWDKLPIETQIDLYKTKLRLEIDAHQQMLKSLDSDKAVRRFGKERWASELEYAHRTLDNLKKRMKEVDQLDVEALRRTKTRPPYLEEPPRLFAKKPPPGSVEPGFVKTRVITTDEIKKAYDAGYMIVPQSGDRAMDTPLLRPRPGVEPSEKLMIISTGEATNRVFRVVANDLNYPEPPPGHLWGVLQRPNGPQKYQLRAIRDAVPEKGFRWHHNLEEPLVDVGPHKTWASRRDALGRGYQATSTFKEFEDQLAQLDISDADRAVLRRWAGPMGEMYRHPLLAGRQAFLDEVFAAFTKKHQVTGELTEAQYEAFYREFRVKFAEVVGSQPAAIRQQVLHGFKQGDVTYKGLLDTFPEPASKGHFFREIARADLATGGRIAPMAELRGFPLRHDVPAGFEAAKPSRDFDDILDVRAPLGTDGPASGKWFVEYKSGAGAFDLEQSLDYAAIFAKGEKEITFGTKKTAVEGAPPTVEPVVHKVEGVVVVFDKAPHAQAAFDELANAPGPRGDAFRQLFGAEPPRFRIGFYDNAGRLTFLRPVEVPPPLSGDIVPRGARRIRVTAPETGSAAHVPGSGFRGIQSDTWPPDAVVRQAGETLANLGDVTRIAPERFRVRVATPEQPDLPDITVRVISRSMGESSIADVATYRYYKHTRTAVITVSDRASAEGIERAMHHEIGELRHLLSGRAGTRDVLGRGLPIDASSRLSPHDAGRVAEIEWLAGRLRRATADPARTADLRRELHALVEELGLRRGFKNAEDRLRLVKERLSPEALEVLSDVRRSLRQLPADDLAMVKDVRLARALDLRVARERAAKGPLRPMVDLRRPGDPPGPLPRRILKERADEAKALREHVGTRTWRKLETAQARGRLLPIDSPWIGGGAALAGLNRSQLLVDDAGRWHIDLSDDIAQTAEQLVGVRLAGLGDPAQAAQPGERVALDAVKAWEDFRAAQGPVLNGRARLEVDPAGGFVMRIEGKDNGRQLVMPVSGIPVIATGFPAEAVPGAARLAANTVNPADVLAARAQTAQAHASWEQLRNDNPGRVHLGDHANAAPFDPTVSNEWLIVGTGGTAISAAEIILRVNEHAKVHMIGGSWTPGLQTNPQFAQVQATVDRFTWKTGVRVERVEGIAPGVRGIRVSISTEVPDVTPRAWTPAEPLTPAAVVVALGGRNRVPPPVAEAVARVQDAGGVVTGVALVDRDGYYLGYRLTFPSGQQVDVTGAASRFPPNDVQFSRAHRDVIDRAEDIDAPWESGNFGGGFAASAEQAERYGRARRRGDI